jgi:hypothetical protein
MGVSTLGRMLGYGDAGSGLDDDRRLEIGIFPRNPPSCKIQYPDGSSDRRS